MSDENGGAEPQEVKTFTADEVEALIAERTGGLKAKVDELLGESKSAKQKARELEELQHQAEEQRLREKEEFKTLYEREQAAKKELSEKYEGFQKKIQSQTIGTESLKIAASLTRDTKRAELLQKEVQQFARYTDDGVQFEIGGVTVDAAKVQEYLTENYPFLVDGSQASGGGAAGSGSRAAGVKSASRADFAKMPPGQQMEFIKSGGQVTND